MISLEHGRYYHIYNRGNNREDLFNENENYNHFLRLYEKYIDPIADTYTWVLMKNHFHLLVRIKEEEKIGSYLPLNSDGSNDSVRFKTTGNNLTESGGPVRVVATNKTNTTEHVRVLLATIPKPNPTKHFSHLFNAYSKYYNKLNSRTGTLFQRPFKRIEVTGDPYIRNLIVYIHTNPVHHKFIEDFTNYPWSSFRTLFSTNPTKLKREQVIEWFGDRDNLLEVHNQKLETEKIANLLLE